MLGLTRLILGVALLLLSTSASQAQTPVNLQIRDGRVTLRAENVALRAILGEWARIGGTNVIGAERVSAAPVSVELTNVPERQALEVLLRNVSGYLLATRPAGVQGSSLYNRILIMPPSVAPRALPQQQIAGPRFPTNVPTSDDDAPNEPVVDRPAVVNRPGQPVRLPVVAGQPVEAVPAPLPVPEPADPTAPQPGGAVVVTPGNPFGVPAGSSSQPGVIAPPPPPQREPATPQQD